MFFDAQSGALRVGDGVTPGGHSFTESSPMESLFIGDWVYFARPDDSPEIVDKIADNLWITRDPQGESGSLWNSAPDGEGTLDSNGSVSTPYGTQWNTDGWQDLSTTKTRYYQNFTPSFSGGGWATTKHEWIMHDTMNDKYYAIRFLSWDSGSNQATGAFSYMRREINTAIYFNREDTNDEETAYVNGDPIAENLNITRGNGQAIFNWGIGPVTNNFHFDPVTDYCDSITLETGTHKVTIENPQNELLIALQQMQVGDPVWIDYTGNNDGTSQTVVTAWDSVTSSFTLDWSADTVNPTFIYLNLTQPGNLENGYDEDVSPYGTLWNAEGHEDLSNLMSRQFMLFDDLWAGQNLGKRIVGKELVMHDTQNDKYYAIVFTRWAQGNDYSYPGFSYTRRLIDVNKLTSGMRFNDGTVQQTAYSEKIAGTIKAASQKTSQVGDRYITPADIGKMIILDGNTTNTLKLPDGGAYDFPIGATITIINRTGGTVYLYKQNDDESGTIYGAGTSSSSTGWDIPDNGGGNICTLIKIGTGMDNYFNDWMLSGSGITVD
jgi:hypothetical protein